MNGAAAHEDSVGSATSQPRRVVSGPAARLLASRLGIDLARVRGTGPAGRVTKHDVMLAGASPDAGSAESCGLPAKPMSSMPGDSTRAYLRAQCRVDRLVCLRDELNEDREQALSVNDLLLRAVVLALREVPGMNVAWSEGEALHVDRVDLAIAAPAPEGLCTPVIRDATAKGVLRISAEARALARRASAGQLEMDDCRGGSFGVSILGMFSADEFAANAHPPLPAILAVDAVRTQTAVNADGLQVPGKVLHCTLSVDSRVVHGALAQTWLSVFRRLVESPLALLI